MVPRILYMYINSLLRLHSKIKLRDRSSTNSSFCTRYFSKNLKKKNSQKVSYLNEVQLRPWFSKSLDLTGLDLVKKVYVSQCLTPLLYTFIFHDK